MSNVYGTDIAQSNGDWTATAQADVALVSGTGNLQQALERRWGTRIGALFYDPTYGNPVWDILSQPINADWIDRATAAAKSCFLADYRVQDVLVTITPNPAKRTALFQCQWTDIAGNIGQTTQEVPAGV